MTTYRSKIGPELVIPLGILLGSILGVFVVNGVWAGAAIILAVVLFIGHMFYTTRYSVTGTSLRIVCGMLYRKTIDIRAIESVRSSNTLASSPAASLDRMELILRGGERITISPKDKQGFLRHLRTVNDRIDIAV